MVFMQNYEVVLPESAYSRLSGSKISKLQFWSDIKIQGPLWMSTSITE